jgi:AGCS family alanine or glycine:cation symporter
LVLTLMWGVRRGLFSNEAGQGSAPIAHAAAKTDEPVSEGVVALLEPFIDTLVICTMTGLVILISGVWAERHPTELALTGGDASWVEVAGDGTMAAAEAPESLEVYGGFPVVPLAGGPVLAWHEVAVDKLWVDPQRTVVFSGAIHPAEGYAEDLEGNRYDALWGMAVESGAPLTKLAFERGLKQFGGWGGWIVLLSVLMFAVSTAISWSYYGDRCANYLFGVKAVLPYKLAFVVMHFIGAVVPLATIWTLGDVALGLCTFPNLVALVLLSGLVVKLTKSYFERRPWEQNALDHKRWVEAHRRSRKGD